MNQTCIRGAVFLLVSLFSFAGLISAQSTLVASQSTLNFDGPVSGSINPQTVTFTGSGGWSITGGTANGIQYQNGFGWASLTNCPNTTGGQCSGGSGSGPTVAISTSGLSAGTYNASFTALGNGGGSATVNIVLCLGPTCIAPPTTNPTSLTFGVALATSQNQMLNITSAAGTTYTATANVTTPSGGNWLSVTSSGNAPGTATVTANAGSLPMGSYSGFVTISSGGASVNVNVTMNVATTSQQPTFILGTPSITYNSATATSTTLLSTPLAISDNGFGSLSWTSALSTSNSSGWLKLTDCNGNSINSGSTPNSACVVIDTSKIVGASDTGSILFNVSNPNVSNATSILPIAVNLSAPVTGQLNVVSTVGSQQSLLFVMNQGASVPPPVNLTVTGTSGAVNAGWVAFPVTSTGGAWLIVNPSNGPTPDTGGVSAGLNSTVASNLASGTYNGSIYFSAPGVATPTIYSVTLVVGGSATFTVSPSTLTFGAPQGGAAPSTQTVILNPSSSSSATWTTTSSATWLSVLPSTGTFSNNLTAQISVNQGTLAVGSYTGTITFAAQGFVSQTVNVTLNATNNAVITVSPTSLTFNGTAGGTIASQSLTLGTSSGTLSYAASASVTTPSGGSWLSVSPTSGTAPGSATVSVNTSGLSVGSYSGTVNFGSGVTVPVTLNLVAGVSVNASPTTLTFTGSASATIPAQTVSVSAASTITFSTQVTTVSGGSWLSVGGNATTPSTLTVSVNPQGLATGTYTGTIQIVSAAASNTPTISVTLNVTAPGTLAASTTSLTFQTATGGTSPTQTLNITNSASTGGSIPWSASVSTNSGGSWLSIAPLAGTTPGSATVTANAGTLAQGAYTGAIVLVSTSAPNTVVIFVTMNVGAPGIAVTPTTLTFSGAAGGSIAAQTLNVASTGTSVISWTATASTQSGGTWLSVSPTSGQSGGTAQVSANIGGLAPGTYSGAVTFTSSTNQQTVNVTLTVSPLYIAGVGPSSLQLLAAAGSSAPVTGGFDVVNRGSGSMAFNVTSSTLSGGNWLSVSPSSGTSPSTVTVTANPAGLATGTYLGSVVVTPTGATNALSAPQTVVVSFAVGAPAIFTGGIVDAGSFAADNSASPGELMSLFGQNLTASSTPSQASSLPLPTILGGTEVLVNGSPVPLFFVSQGQINFQMPALTGNAAVVSVVSGTSSTTPATQISLVPIHPAIFPVAGGQGLGQILNANSSANSPANPASAGQVIQIFATGLGVTNPPLTPGQPGNSVAPFNAAVVTPAVTIGGINASVTFSAAAPGLAGVFQVNAVVPSGLPSGGFAAVQISSGGKLSNTVMLAVK